MRDSADGTERRTTDSSRNFRHKSTRRHDERKLILWNELARELVHDARGDEFELWDVVPLCVRVVAIAVVGGGGGGVFVDVIASRWIDHRSVVADVDLCVFYVAARRFELERVVLLPKR